MNDERALAAMSDIPLPELTASLELRCIVGRTNAAAILNAIRDGKIPGVHSSEFFDELIERTDSLRAQLAACEGERLALGEQNAKDYETILGFYEVAKERDLAVRRCEEMKALLKEAMPYVYGIAYDGCYGPVWEADKLRERIAGMVAG